MFLVADTIDAREARIAKFLSDGDGAIAVLAAAAHFEWVIGRAILVMGNTPTKELRVFISMKHGLEAYKDLWRDEVMAGRNVPRLAELIPKWQEFIHAFSLRHRLIHGRISVTLYYASIRVPQMLAAARSLNVIAGQCGFDLFSRLPLRRKHRLPIAEAGISTDPVAGARLSATCLMSTP